MRQLVIEYVLEGHQRGYNFTSPTNGFADDILKHIWRTAMPRGQGWSAYTGAVSLKCFPLEDGTAAASEVTVTDQRDESGRTGIRRAVVYVMRLPEYETYLYGRLNSYPKQVREYVENKPSYLQRARIVNKTLPKVRGEPRLILAHPYQNAESWMRVEAFLIKLALRPVGAMSRWGKVIPFTTLALDYRDESPLVALPAEKADQVGGAPMIRLR